MDPPPQRCARRGGAGALLLTLLLALLAGCGTTDPSGEPDPTGAEDGVILIADFSYQVPTSVPAGSQVRVRNEDGVGHSVTSDEPGTFDVTVGPGEETMLTVPEEPGEYPFRCTPHPTMTATLVVQEG